MQMSDAVEVIEVHGQGLANGKLAEGWKLLAVFPGIGLNGRGTYAVYVLGKAAAQGDPLANLNPARAGQP